MSKVLNVVNKITYSLFPRRCPVCEDIVEVGSKYICKKCLPKLSFVKNPVCLKCGKELLLDYNEFCEDCIKNKKSFEFGKALLNYDDISENAMIKIKYKNKRDYIEGFSRLLAIRYKDLICKMQADYIIPIPIHKERLRERGYNQAKLIAEYVSYETGICIKEILKRKKNTKAQKSLNPKERLKNLENAFYCDDFNEDIKNVILIDDIYTTGSTIEACTRALKSKGVKNVYFLTICIGKGA